LQCDPIAFAKILEDASNIRTYYLNSICSIIQNILKPLSISNGSIVSINTDKPIKFTLLIESKIAMLYSEYILEDMQNMKNNVIEYTKDL
jgi:hypothetical protein